MNRQWMYGNRRTSEYIKGVHNFLEVAEANKQNGFMCRSLCSNKYDGFKVPPISDIRKTNSKVKPRVIPSMGTSASVASSTGEIPLPTPIATLQSIGVNKCAIPATEFSEEALLVEPVAVSEPLATATDMEDQGEDLSHNSA